jgi:very-short-patch-repair endonuclease
MTAARYLQPRLVGDIMFGGTSVACSAAEIKLWLAGRKIIPSVEQLAVLQHARSGAEALLAWQFAKKPGTRVVDGAFVNNELTLLLDVPARRYFIDMVAWRDDFRLAIEVDGYAFHHRTPDQVANDDLRQRRIVLYGYTVIRFGAREIFRDAAECWRQVEAIIRKRTNG